MTDHELRSRTAHDLHARAIIFDGHNDSLMLKHANGDPLDFGLPADGRDESRHYNGARQYHVDLTRMKQAGLTALNSFVGSRDLAISLDLWDALYWHVETYPDDFLLARTAGDVRRAKAEGKVALVGQLESCACLHSSLRVLSVQHRLGLRVANLVHFEGVAEHEHAVQVDKAPFDYTDAAAREAARHEMKGLTGFGRDLIAACNDLGIIVDTAHANDATFYEAVALSDKPCIFSHGGVFAVCPHWRGLTDDQIRALAAKGGVMGVAFYDKFIDRDAPTLERLMDHVEHVVSLVGPDHIGFGSDFDGLPEGSVPIPAHLGLLHEFTDGLIRRGFDEATILKILGGNFLRVMAEVCG